MKKLILWGMGILFILSASAQTVNKDYTLWYDRPACNRGSNYNQLVARGFPYDEDWQRWSLPLGNGYMGINVFGRTDTERIQLSEATLANGGCYHFGGFTNFAEIYLDFYHYGTKSYKRSLCLNDAVSTVTYIHEGVTYSREYFVSYPSNLVAVKLKADQPKQLSFTVRPVIPYLGDYNRKDDSRSGKVTASNDLIQLSGMMDFFDLPYEAQVKVVNYGGTLQSINDAKNDHGTIRVNHADSVVLYLAAGTSYQLNEEVFVLPAKEKCAGNEHPHRAVSERISRAMEMGYDVLRREHVADYRSLFDRVAISLTDKVPDMPTDKLLVAYKEDKNRESSAYLEELYFQFGRYLLISSSRPGTLPPNLQGVWTQYDYSPWSAGYWHNVNIQMNYWPAFSTNLAETFEAFVDYNEAYRKAAQKLATEYIRKNNPQNLSYREEENGWTIGTGASAYGITAPGGHSGPGTGGFTTKLFWDYYDFTRDRKLLSEHVFPALEGMAKFLSKALRPDGKGHLLAVPSSSPEQYHQGKVYTTKGCAFDQGMIWENFHDLLNAAEILKKKNLFLKLIRKQITQLDPVLIGESGQLKEFREEKRYSDIGDPNHRHISHLCLLYPGTLINETTPAWLEAARVALENRSESGYFVGWPTAHRQNAWARLKNGDKAYSYYKKLLNYGVYDNLWGVCPPFQIDSNLGGTAGVAEMLLQSHEGYIAPLPAIPGIWERGSYRGLVARGNFVVDADWEHGKATCFKINSRMGEICRIQYPEISVAQLTDSMGKLVKFKKINEDEIEFHTQKGQQYKVLF